MVAYRLKRSTAPAAKQESRVYLTEGSPALKRFDYVVLSKKFESFPMRYVNPRVRGIGNPMDAPNWYWKCDPPQAAFSLVPHPQPLPAEMLDPGETCLQVRAGAGPQAISQTVFIGTEHGNESLWYGQLEPGKQYRLEVWLRQEGLAGSGAVTFSYGKSYPGIRQTFNVTDQWRKYTYDFTGPERPKGDWHFGHQFSFTGRQSLQQSSPGSTGSHGTLWMDNCRVFRWDRPEDREKQYVPNATVLDELLASQPATGRKGAHRIWFLGRDATMASILSWHAGSKVNPDWNTSVGGTMDMTLPMGLTFDLHTGPDAGSRMRPWLVLQHILHTEDDWQALVEYLAAPYDPHQDTPQGKPWAYRRFRQRGTGTPWTDEFESIVIEFGNETWHNAFFPDWIGFRTHGAIHQGGPEYGLFARYLIENIRKSPYWKARHLEGKIRFDLGGNYQAEVGRDGRVRGYVEEALQNCPWATLAGHANYVGPQVGNRRLCRPGLRRSRRAGNAVELPPRPGGGPDQDDAGPRGPGQAGPGRRRRPPRLRHRRLRRRAGRLQPAGTRPRSRRTGRNQRALRQVAGHGRGLLGRLDAQLSVWLDRAVLLGLRPGHALEQPYAVGPGFSPQPRLAGTGLAQSLRPGRSGGGARAQPAAAAARQPRAAQRPDGVSAHRRLRPARRTPLVGVCRIPQTRRLSRRRRLRRRLHPRRAAAPLCPGRGAFGSTSCRAIPAGRTASR